MTKSELQTLRRHLLGALKVVDRSIMKKEMNEGKDRFVCVPKSVDTNAKYTYEEKIT